jgi:uncharacterized repeat protein (TIGR03803 family)
MKCPGHLYGCGAVWELTPTSTGLWQETTLHDFTGVNGDGSSPTKPLAFDQQGNLYSTTYNGGISNNACPDGCGTLFKLSPVAGGGWNYSVSYSFGATISDAAIPGGPVIFDAQGNLYSWSGGGTYGYGTVFKLTPTGGGSWTESILYNFQGGTNGGGPGSLVFDSAGNLYGTTDGSTNCPFDCGTIIKLTPSGSGTWTETVPFVFNSTDGAYPVGMILDTHGNFYGAAQSGGSAGHGVVFQFRP